MSRLQLLYCFSVFLPLLLFSSCKQKKGVSDNVLLRFGERELTYNEVVSQIPDGIIAADSAAMFNSIIDGWMKDAVLADLAEERLYDLSSIERKVRDYRNHLIVTEYLSHMRESHTPKIDERNVKEYYDKYRNDLKLEVPLVRGIFLKVNSEAKGKEKIRKLLTSEDPQSIDKLEQEWLDRALEYNYFRDKWVDWETVAGMIPHRFGDPNDYLKNNTYFETDYGDCSYYLQISDWMPAGEQQPYEFAATWIAGVLTRGDLADFEKALVESIINKSIKDKKLEGVGYDPVRHELIENYVIVEDE